jgi:release factor glutamine methyltransferase
MRKTNLTILDLATGSGCIALALAQALPRSTVYASDVSYQALELTKKNIQHNKVHNIIPLFSDLFYHLDPIISYDLIVANPPYIPESARKNLDESVIAWEDQNALFAGEDGLYYIKRIIDQALCFLKQNSDMSKNSIAQLVIEIDATQGDYAKEYMKHAGYHQVQILQDFAGNDRIICGMI